MEEKWLTLVPAYGRDYHSTDDVLYAWEQNKDFIICDISCKDDGRYINKQDAEGSDYNVMKIRYNRLADFCLIKQVRGKWVLEAVEDGEYEEVDES